MSLVLVNRKTGEELEVDITEQEAIAIVEKLSSEFAKSIVQQAKTKGLTPAQAFWLYKLAKENKQLEPILLLTNLQEFCSKANELTFDTFTLTTYRNEIVIRRGPITWGRIVENKFFPTAKCPEDVKLAMYVMSSDPMKYLQESGRRTGRCCVCGLTLTNPTSIELGIGPICREKF